MYHTMFDASRKRDPKYAGAAGRKESTAYKMAREIREREAARTGAAKRGFFTARDGLAVPERPAALSLRGWPPRRRDAPSR